MMKILELNKSLRTIKSAWKGLDHVSQKSYSAWDLSESECPISQQHSKDFESLVQDSNTLISNVKSGLSHLSVISGGTLNVELPELPTRYLSPSSLQEV